MRLLVIHNLSSGFQDGSIYDFLRMLARDGDEACVRYTDGTTDITSMLYDADRYDAVVAAGGDGTVAAVSYALRYTGIPILPYPAGTGNLLSSNLKSPIEANALAAMVRDMKCLDFDLGEITAGGMSFGFSIMAGAGYDAAIMHDAKPTKKILGPAAYFQAAISNPTPQKSEITLTVDGETIKTEGLGVLLVNFSRIQFEIALTPGADARDGLLEVVVLKAENAFGLIPAFMAGVMDRDGVNPERPDSIEIHRGNRVEVVADPPFEIQYDGELPELETPLSAHVLNQASRFIVSENAYELYTR